MSTLEVNKITPVSGGTTVQVGESGDTINIPSGATIANAGTATGFGITAANFLPNATPLIINGSMNVAQRATQVTGYTSISYSTCDRWYTVCEIGTYTISQESLSDADFNTTGFRKALKLDCTTIEAPPSAGAQTNVEMRFEGQDLQVFQKGTANAKKYTLSFWVRASKTGSNLQVNFKDNDNTRMCSGTYNISSANTWEKKIINIAADTTGKFDNDNASSLTIEWFLDGGSNYSGGAVPTSWEAKNNADRNVTNFDLGGSTSNDWAITGVQLEVGEYTSATIPPFQHESFGNSLQRCLRYFEKTYEIGVNPGTATGTGIIRSGGNQGGRTSGRMGDSTTYVVGKRAAPTVVFFDSAGNSGVMTRLDQGSSSSTNQNATLANGSSKSMEITSTGTSTADCMNYHFTADAEL